MKTIIRLESFLSSDEPLAAALNHCVDNGGIIRIPKGDWLTGPVVIPPGTTLELENGAIVRFRETPENYLPVFTRWEGVECHGYQPLVSIRNSENVRIVGEGVFDGSGAGWWDTYRNIRQGTTDPASVQGVSRIQELNTGRAKASGGGGRSTGFLRPPLIQINSTTDVVLEGIEFRNSPFWTAHILYSRDVEVRNCHFSNPPDSPNTDGLNIDSSTSVKIIDCVFDVGDDCLCLKSGSDEDGRRVNRPTENVTVSGCRMYNGHGGIVVGSEISGGVKNIHITDCEMEGTDRGIRIKNRRGRGGFVRRIDISNIRMRQVPFPVVINCYYRCGITEDELDIASDPQPAAVSEKTPVIEDITLSGISAEGVSTAITVLGLPESPVRDLKISDWKITTDQSPGRRKENPAMDFHDTLVDVPGLFSRNTVNPEIKNITIDGKGMEPHDET